MRLISLAIWISVAAAALGCGSRSTTAPLGNGSGVATGPAPTVGSEANQGDFSHRFVATGLPAVASDGANVALVVMGEDGARGAPNLAVVVKDRADAEVHRLVVQTADDGEAGLADEGPAPAVAGRLTEANRYLAETHAQRGWHPLAAMALAENAGGEQARQASHEGVELRWDEGKVVVSVGGKVVVERQTAGWTVTPTEHCAGCGVCSNPSFLGGAWVDPGRKLVVARISYMGTDTCWEPDSVDHVIAWE